MSLLDIAKANGVEQVVDESSKTVPEMTVIPSFPLTGLTVRSVVYTGQSNSTGSFRKVGAGTSAITETSEQRDFQCFTAEPRIEVDRAEADYYDGGSQAYIGGKSKRVLSAEMVAWAKQMYYGTSNNADGFPGIVSLYDSANMVVDAGGTTASTGSSVWFLRVAADGNLEDDGVRWRFGQGGRMTFDPVQLLPVVDPADATKKFMAYITTFTAYPGFQVQNIFSVGRIKKVTEDASHSLNDDFIDAMLAKFPVGKGPNLITMTKRSARQLKDSRTATSPTGAPAPWPNSIMGTDGQEIPIRVTEALLDTESLTL